MAFFFERRLVQNMVGEISRLEDEGTEAGRSQSGERRGSQAWLEVRRTFKIIRCQQQCLSLSPVTSRARFFI